MCSGNLIAIVLCKLHSSLLNYAHFFYISKFFSVLVLSSSVLLALCCLISLVTSLSLTKYWIIILDLFCLFVLCLSSIRIPALPWSLTYHKFAGGKWSRRNVTQHSTVKQDLINTTFKKKFKALWEICEAECAAQHLAKEIDLLSVNRNWSLHLLYYINSTSSL